MELFCTSTHARIAPVAQHCTHDFVFIFSLSVVRTKALLSLSFASPPRSQLLSICILGLDSCLLVGRRLNDCPLQQAAHTCFWSRDSMNPRLSPNDFSVTPADLPSVTIQPYSLASGHRRFISKNRSCRAPHSKPSSDCLGAITHFEDFGTKWDLF